jgi:predicted membrane channel-forming protein YqfA (hemolysin III family)
LKINQEKQTNFMFTSIVCCCCCLNVGAAPATHACILHGLPRMFQMGLLYLVIMAVTYIAGGIAYAIRVPERFFPGNENSDRDC